MGILRTDKISGLETPTAVTGSVVFDGNGDYLSFATSTDFALGTDDWTVEWFAYPTSETQYQRHFYLQGSSSSNIDGVFADSSGIAFGRTGVWAATAVLHPLNQWNHYALVHDSTNMRLYINGVESTTSTSNFGTDSTKTLNIGYSNSTFGGYFTGNISNFRILRGTALYTSDFTVPTQELEVIGDTVLLCCNNPDSAGAEATGKTITVNGDAAASTVSPGLTRDFTGGTEFRGVTTFDTQGYFVPPSGTTTDRNRTGGRILWAGGSDGGAAPGFINLIQYANITTTGNALDFGDMVERATSAASSSSTRAVIFDGLTPSLINRIEKVEIASTGNASDFGDSTMSVYETASASNNTRGLNGGGYSSGSGTPANTETIEYVTIASIGNASDFGDLTMGRRAAGALSSPIRACFAAGYQQPDASGTRTDRIDYVTIASTGDAIDFGNLTQSGWGPAAMSNSVRGVYAGRLSPGSPGFETTIDYITIASTGDAVDFGDTTTGSGRGTGSSNKTRGVFVLGNAAPSPNIQNHIDYITIATTGNAKDFGDLVSRTHQAGSTSDSHGGLS